MNDLNIGNICNGKFPEVFDKAIREAIKNIKDPNTEAKAIRKVSVTFSLKPGADRSTCAVSFTVKTGLQSVIPVEGTIFITGTQSDARAFARDPRQDPLFDQETDAHKA